MASRALGWGPPLVPWWGVLTIRPAPGPPAGAAPAHSQPLPAPLCPALSPPHTHCAQKAGSGAFLGLPRAGQAWLWDPSGLGFFAAQVSPSPLLVGLLSFSPRPPQGWSGSALPRLGMPLLWLQCLPGRPTPWRSSVLCKASVLGSSVGRGCPGRTARPLAGEGRAAPPSTGRALCQPLWPAPSVWGRVTQVDARLQDALPEEECRPGPRGALCEGRVGSAAWTCAVVAGTVPASFQWSCALSRSRMSRCQQLTGRGIL